MWQPVSELSSKAKGDLGYAEVPFCLPIQLGRPVTDVLRILVMYQKCGSHCDPS